MKKNIYLFIYFLFLIFFTFKSKNNNNNYSEEFDKYEKIENEIEIMEKIENKELEEDILSDFVSSKKKHWKELKKISTNCCHKDDCSCNASQKKEKN